MKTDDLEILVQYIKDDDENNFRNILDENKEYNLSFGRFPLISVLYLYDSKKILKSFGKRLLSYDDYEVENELPIIYNDFRILAKRCLRFYLTDDFITPYDILLLKGDNQEFERISVNYKFSDSLLERFSSVCVAITGYKLKKNAKKIILPQRELVGRRKKFTIASLSIFVFFAIISSFLGFFAIYSNNNLLSSTVKIKNQTTLLNVLKSEKEINFVIDKDIYFDVLKWETINLNREIDGNNHKIVFKGNYDKPIFEEVNSSIKNIEFVFDNITITSNIFDNIMNSGSIENCKFTFNNSVVEYDDSFSLLCNNNVGTISDVEFDMNITFKATNTESEKGEKHIDIIAVYNHGIINDITLKENINVIGVNIIDYVFSNICVSNSYYGTIKNINIIDSNFNLTETSFIGMAIDNSGEISDCDFNYNLIATNGTFQTNLYVMGYVASNNGKITSCNYSGDMSVTTSTGKGAIYISGVAKTNNATISGSIVKGLISSKMNSNNTEYLYCGGIAIENYGTISKSKFNGNMETYTKNSVMIVGGICTENLSTSSFFGRNPGVVTDCISEGNIKVRSEQGNISIIGGIIAFCHYTVKQCTSLCNFDYDKIDNTYVGGIIGELSNLTYTDEIFENYFCNNVYLKNNDVLGICGYYNNNELLKYKEDLPVINGYISAENIKGGEYYW